MNTLDWLNNRLMLSSPSVMNLNIEKRDGQKMSRLQRHV